MAAKSSYWLVY